MQDLVVATARGLRIHNAVLNVKTQCFNLIVFQFYVPILYVSRNFHRLTNRVFKFPGM